MGTADFALVASATALMENCPTVPGTAEDASELTKEITDLFRKLKVRDVLSGWTAVAKITAERPSSTFSRTGETIDFDVYLLVLNPDTFTVNVEGYARENLAAANEAYIAIEKNQPNLQAVLVCVYSIDAVRTAYPNYFWIQVPF